MNKLCVVATQTSHERHSSLPFLLMLLSAENLCLRALLSCYTYDQERCELKSLLITYVSLYAQWKEAHAMIRLEEIQSPIVQILCICHWTNSLGLIYEEQWNKLSKLFLLLFPYWITKMAPFHIIWTWLIFCFCMKHENLIPPRGAFNSV